MLVLGLESSEEVLSLAVTKDEEVIAQLDKPARRSLAEIIAASIQEMLASASLKVSSLSGLAVSVGPGSFTGVRIGISVMKGLAWASSLPIAGVSVFEQVAYQSGLKHGRVCVLAEGRNQIFMGSHYQLKGGLPKPEGEFFTASWDRLSILIPADSKVIPLAQVRSLEALKKGLPKHDVLINNGTITPQGQAVAILGYHKLTEDQVTDPRILEPIYLEKAVYRSKTTDEWIAYPPDGRS